jgi:hypothetical protein
MKKLISILILVFVQLNAIRSQNMVQNPSFENMSNCPTTLDQLGFSNGWNSYLESPDYFNSCSTIGLGVPSNAIGYQQASDGEAYAGFIAYGTGGQAREIVGGLLTQSLSIGQLYYVSLKVALAEFDATSTQYVPCNKIGVRFSTTPFSTLTPVPIDNYAHIYTNTIISDTLNWTVITGTFVADSGYKYIMIGNFFDDANTDTIYRPNGVYGYYFVDEVCVTTTSNNCSTINNTIHLEQGNDKIKLFPNPANEFLTIDCDFDCNIILTDHVGKVVYSATFNYKKHINLKSFENGIYFLQTQIEGKSFTNKIIINH